MYRMDVQRFVHRQVQFQIEKFIFPVYVNVSFDKLTGKKNVGKRNRWRYFSKKHQTIQHTRTFMTGQNPVVFNVRG